MRRSLRPRRHRLPHGRRRRYRLAQRLGIPRRIVTILEGESLINDATGIVAYRVAVAAVATGSFSLW